MKILLWWFALCLLFGTAYGAEDGVNIDKCQEGQIYIKGDVEIVSLLQVFQEIRACTNKFGQAVVYVRGNGGSLEEAQVFFDLMRTSGVSQKTTFVATGMIASASNIVWLAAETRIVLPGTHFLLHKASLRMFDEDQQTRQSGTNHTFKVSVDSVHLATSEVAAKRWKDILRGDAQGIVLNADEALKLGWATERKNYITDVK